MKDRESIIDNVRELLLISVFLSMLIKVTGMDYAIMGIGLCTGIYYGISMENKLEKCFNNN